MKIWKIGLLAPVGSHLPFTVGAISEANGARKVFGTLRLL